MKVYDFLGFFAVLIVLSTSDGSPNTPNQRALICAEGCHLSCRGSSESASPNRFCYCRCRPSTIDYGTLVYTAVVDDIWQVRCGYLGHPFVATALAMNESGLLDEFAVTRCESDYTDECRSEPVNKVCTQWWATSLCLDTCAGFVQPTTTAANEPSTTDGQSEISGLCPADKYFRSQRPSFGNPYRGCMDLQSQCDTMYDRGYCQLKPGTVNCQETCGRCVGDDAYMPWNPVRSQLIQWALNRRDDGTSKALANYFLRQYSDYMSEVHRSCRPETVLEAERRQAHRNRHGNRDRTGERDSE